MLGSIYFEEQIQLLIWIWALSDDKNAGSEFKNFEHKKEEGRYRRVAETKDSIS